jgi:DNA excision repair protein ERCC-4
MLPKTRHIIIVDTREFKSLLPYHLHEAGFWVIPSTIVVGDYILSNTIAVERKAVSTEDLMTSLNTGRLHE